MLTEFRNDGITDGHAENYTPLKLCFVVGRGGRGEYNSVYAWLHNLSNFSNNQKLTQK